MAPKTAIGLMSGTSMDGIDVALLRTDGDKMVERGPSSFFAYSPDTIFAVKQALEDAKSCEIRTDRPGSLDDVEAQLTRLHIDAVGSFLEQNNLNSEAIDLLGFHGQTVLHRPDKGFTIQLGDGAFLAAETGIDCVYDMRANDMVHGGQGAPLVPVYHQALTQTLPGKYLNKNICFVNIGGISNITYVGQDLIAFDVGPGNALIDQWVQAHAGIPYDQGGIIAAEGAVQMKLADTYLSNAFFDQRLPKSLDRNDFLPPQADAGGVEDVARTLAHVTAASIMRSVQHLPAMPDVWIICGGGRHNPHIMRDISALAAEHSSKVIAAEEVDLNGDSMEAECWAYLAVRSQSNLPLTYPGTTGVSKPVSGGKLARS